VTAAFKLALDTATRVGAEINGGAESSAGSNVTLELTLDPDAIEIKVWGQIDPDSPLNTGLGVTEGEAAWMLATPSLLVALEEGEGPRQLHVRVKDDVWNEATATTSIFVGDSTPLPTPSPRPGGPPTRRPRREIERRTITSRSRLGARSRGAARASTRGPGGVRAGSTARLRAVAAGSTNTTATITGVARVRATSAAAVRSDAAWRLNKSLGDETQAAVTLLL
jgi:hypothetical protein